VIEAGIGDAQSVCITPFFINLYPSYGVLPPLTTTDNEPLPGSPHVSEGVPPIVTLKSLFVLLSVIGSLTAVPQAGNFSSLTYTIYVPTGTVMVVDSVKSVHGAVPVNEY
jgi:hypothetical protein